MDDENLNDTVKSPGRRALVILGMHRSGTSLLSAMLCSAGVDAPKNLMPADAFNETGYWEPTSVQQLNDRLLQDLGSAWHSELNYPTDFFLSPKAQQWHTEIGEALRLEYQQSPLFCLKEPRISRLLPLWAPVFRSEGIEPSYVITVRNPLEVAQSLKDRDGFHWSKSLMVWLRHTLDAEKHTRGQRRVFVSYDRILKDWRYVLRRIADRLEVVWPRRLSQIDLDFERVISRQLKHHDIPADTLDTRTDIANWIAATFHACVACVHDSEAEQIPVFDRIRAELEIADKAFEPLLVTQHDVLRSARNEAEARVHDLQGQIQERDAELSAIKAENADATTRLSHLSNQLTYIAARFQGRESEIESLTTQLERSETLSRELAAQVQTRENDLQASRAQNQNACLRAEELASDLATAKAELDQRESETRSVSNQLKASHDEAKQLTERIENCDADLEKCRAEYALLSQRAQQLGIELAGAEASLNARNVEVRTLTSNLESSRIDAKQLTTQIQMREAELRNASAEADAARSELLWCRNELWQIRSVLLAAESQVAALSTSVSQLNADLTLTREESQSHHGRSQELEKEQQRLQQTVSHLEEKLRAFSEEVALARNAELSAHDELAQEQSASASMRVELAAVRAALNAARADAATAEAQLSVLQAQRRELAELLRKREADAVEADTSTVGEVANGGSHHTDVISVAYTPAPRMSTCTLTVSNDCHERELETNHCNIGDWQVFVADSHQQGLLHPTGTIGVFVHIHYEELSSEIAAALRNIPYDFRVYVSTTDELKKSLIEMSFAREGVRDVVVSVLPNAGRDIGPFLFGFREQVRSHEICLRLHSKKSTHCEGGFGTAWRRHLFNELLGDRDRVGLVINEFMRRPDLGALIPSYWRGVGSVRNVGVNRQWLKWLLDRIGVSTDFEKPIDFPCGSMFWFRSAAIEPLLQLNLSPQDFIDSNEQNRDSSLAHGFERVFLFSAAKAGLTWGFVPPWREASTRKFMVAPTDDECIAVVRDSGLFDQAYYLARNPDVAAAGIDALEHFMKHGYLERRDPSATFDTEYYARTAFLMNDWDGNPLVHYILYGRDKSLPTAEPRRGPSTDETYTEWLRQNASRHSDIVRMKQLVDVFPYRPTISIITAVYNTPEKYLRATIDSVLAQAYPDWELCLADDASTEPHVRAVLDEYARRDRRIKVTFRESNGHISNSMNSALTLATGDFIGLLDHDDLLTPDALFEVCALLNRHQDADMVYSDEDKIDEGGALSDPFFKPDWCPDSFLSRMYTCHFGVYRRSLVEAVGRFRSGFDGSQDYDLVLRISERTSHIYHIPRILYHWRIHPASTASGSEAKPYTSAAAEKAIAEALQRRGESGVVSEVKHVPGTYIVRYDIKEHRRVSILLYAGRYGDTLDRCLDSIFSKSTYPDFEVLILCNSTSKQAGFAAVQRWSSFDRVVRVIEYDATMGAAAISNFGVSQATGTFVVFIHADTEVISADWLEAMVEQAQRPSIGAVGATLLYPDDTVQHAGIIVGIQGVAAHSHKHVRADKPGYFSTIKAINNYSAVSVACLMVRNEVLKRLGGFDEDFKVAFYDVDFCLKLRSAGFYNVCLPHSLLYHFESKGHEFEDPSEEMIFVAKDVERIKTRWRTEEAPDPCYNPNLSQQREDFSLRV